MKLTGFSKTNFTCDSCGKEFQQEVAYSMARNWEELDNNHTYCVNCVEKKEKKAEKESKPKTKKQKSWGSAPIDEVSENTQSLNIDKRTLKKTGRVHLFATRVKKEWIEQLKSIAYEERKHYNEVLEKALECYSKQRKK
ncbi:protein of unknown function [endosymbiont DhMRE of Dentiscutata heterogama]|uniref:hypothetical protein n=1 Tax=endosymbiont DhMRE of Dentiscutata heterogama TaxID=1609546 RepID=UPI0006303DFD|nr:hypothetical protein [endosymbiont DhMRE of Dentiscutata heterogama]CFW92690.1 protein of unknown function [endosymbiont DhMRE of Dentiscutata heterogama]